MSEEELRARIDALERALDTAIIYLTKSPRTPDQTVESIFVMLDALEKAKCKDMGHLDNQKIQPR